jgi:hypothetical protein
MRIYSIAIAAVILGLAGVAQAADSGRRVVIYDNTATEVVASSEPSEDLWITTRDLGRATKFEIKPQGVCRDELCFPLPKDKKDRFVVKKASGAWFNLTEFARLLKQPVASDSGHSIWLFGPRPAAQNDHIRTLEAPEFTLPDIAGKMHSLSGYRGKKVLLVTWASW